MLLHFFVLLHHFYYFVFHLSILKPISFILFFLFFWLKWICILCNIYMNIFWTRRPFTNFLYILITSTFFSNLPKIKLVLYFSISSKLFDLVITPFKHKSLPYHSIININLNPISFFIALNLRFVIIPYAYSTNFLWYL